MIVQYRFAGLHTVPKSYETCSFERWFDIIGWCHSKILPSFILSIVHYCVDLDIVLRIIGSTVNGFLLCSYSLALVSAPSCTKIVLYQNCLNYSYSWRMPLWRIPVYLVKIVLYETNDSYHSSLFYITELPSSGFFLCPFILRKIFYQIIRWRYRATCWSQDPIEFISMLDLTGIWLLMYPSAFLSYSWPRFTGCQSHLFRRQNYLDSWAFPQVTLYHSFIVHTVIISTWLHFVGILTCIQRSQDISPKIACTHLQGIIALTSGV